TEARISPSARVLDAAAPTLVAVAEGADTAHLADVAVLRLPRAKRGLDLVALLAELYRRDVRSVLVEGGPTLAGSFLHARLVDRVVGYVAPAMLGAGPAALAGTGVCSIDAALRLRLDEVTRVGPDLRLVARFPAHDEPAGHEPATGEER
ncbi:MAG: RibD family protein, partial [Streptomycetales bacterium]